MKSRKSLPAGRQGFIPIIIAIVVAVAVLTGGGYVAYKYIAPQFQPQVQPEQNTNQTENQTVEPSDPTASWKTYTNSQYGFEFKYPSKYDIKTYDHVRNGPDDAIISYILIGKFPNNLPTALVDYYQINVKGDIYSLEGLKNYFVDSRLASDIQPVVNTTLAGQSATEMKFYQNVGGGAYVDAIGTVKNNTAYIVSAWNSQASNKNQQEFNQIISTFKFTSSNWDIDDCISYGQLPNLIDCYNKYCSKVSPKLEKELFVGKTITSSAASGTWWNFINNDTATIEQGRGVDDSAVPIKYKTWNLESGQLTVKDSTTFKNFSFYDCGDGKMEGIAFSSYMADNGDGYKEHLSEYRIQTVEKIP